jgi:hypothetical protein
MADRARSRAVVRTIHPVVAITGKCADLNRLPHVTLVCGECQAATYDISNALLVIGNERFVPGPNIGASFVV